MLETLIQREPTPSQNITQQKNRFNYRGNLDIDQDSEQLSNGLIRSVSPLALVTNTGVVIGKQDQPSEKPDPDIGEIP